MVVHGRRRRHAARRTGIDRRRHHPRRRRRSPRRRTSRSPASSSPAPSPSSPPACSRSVRGGRLAAALTFVVNSVAVGAWAATRLFDISWIGGLEHSEPPAFTDTVCAALGAIAVVAALAAMIRRRTAVTAVHLGVPAWAIGSFVVVAMLLGATHDHGAGEAAGHTHDDAAALAPDTTDGHSHDHDRRRHGRRPRRARRRFELAAGVRPEPADRRVGRRRRDPGRGAPRRRADPAHAGGPAPLRRCDHGGSARLPVDRRRLDRVRALHQLLLHRRRQVPRSRPRRSRSSTASTATSARSCRRCTSPTESPSTTPRSSATAAR